MTDLDLLILALTNIADRGQVTVQAAGAFRNLAFELKRLDEERKAFDAVHQAGS